MQRGIYVYSEYHTIYTYNNQTLKTMLKKNIKLILVMSAMILAGQDATAQLINRWIIPGFKDSETIVRRWNSSNTVGYGTDSVGENCFFIWDYNATSPPLLASIIPLPTGLVVHDFQILNDTVYFCGSDSYQGIVGFFDINDILSGGTTINYADLSPISGPYVTCARRMDVFKFKGATHIAFVGDMLSTTSGLPITTTTIGDTYWDGASWFVDYYLTNGDMTYTDIAAGTSHIVVAAKEKSTSDCYVQAFNLSSDILTTPLILTIFNTSYMFKLTGRTPAGDVRVEHINATEFAVAFHYDDLGIVGTDVKLIDVDPVTPTVIVNQTLTTPIGTSAFYSSACSMKQLSYNSITRRLFLLQDAVCNLYLPPTLESSIIWYDLASIGSGYVNMSYMPNIVVDRMDAASTGLFFTIGGSGGQMMMSLDYSTPAQACRTDLLLQYDVSEGLVVEIPHTDTKIGMFRATDHQLWIPTNYVPYYFDCRE